MKKLFDLQLFADDAASDSAPGTAGKADDGGAAADTGKEQKEQKADRQTPKYSDDDLDKILGKRFARWQQDQQKAVDEAKKLAEMDATQKAEYERDQLKKELADLKRKDSISEMTKTARKMLSDKNISITDELLAMMVTTDAEETKKAIDGFTKAFTDAVENAVKERLRGNPPRRGSGSAPAMTKEQIMAIRDPELRQKKMLEHRELFNI
jgi:hypothetical protein